MFLGLVNDFRSTNVIPEIAECLIEARCLVEQGWHQYHFVSIVDDEIAYCAVGAMYATSNRDGLYKRVLREFAKANKIEKEEGPLSDEMGITMWNDYPFRTKEEVLDAFDNAIERVSC